MRCCRPAPGAKCAGVAPSKENYGLQPEPFNEVADIGLLLSIYLTGLAMFLVAASFIGAEFTTGAIANWLSFVPRRVPVFGSKLITVTTFALLVSVLASAFVLGMAALLTSVHGGDVSGLRAQLSMAGRGVAVVGALAVVGYCIGLITRHRPPRSAYCSVTSLFGSFPLWVSASGHGPSDSPRGQQNPTWRRSWTRDTRIPDPRQEVDRGRREREVPCTERSVWPMARPTGPCRGRVDHRDAADLPPPDVT